jgi:hypothetical protein
MMDTTIVKIGKHEEPTNWVKGDAIDTAENEYSMQVHHL